MQCQCFCQINGDDHRIGKELFPCNGENVGQYQLWSIIIVWYEINITSLLIIEWPSSYDLGSVLYHHWMMIWDQYYVIRGDQPTTDITARFRSYSLSLWISSSVTFGFVWKQQHLDLCPKTFIFPLDLTFHIFAVPRCQFHRPLNGIIFSC